MKIIFIGFGVVGQSVGEALIEKKRELLDIYGIDPKTVAVVDSGGAAFDQRGLDLDSLIKLKKKGESVADFPGVGCKGLSGVDVLGKVESDVMIEMTPTNLMDSSLGLTNVETALKAGVNVITTNKGPLAHAMPALIETASYNNVEFKFGGTVGGGTPILEMAKRCLQGDRITSIRAILNGTSNYILTRMFEEKTSIDDALKDAQKLGYAESDPTYDIEGIDAAVKLVIIANWIMGMSASIDDVEVEGIRNLCFKDIEKAEKKDQVIKLLGSIGEDLRVKPQRISRRDPLNVGGTLNSVSFSTEYSGDITLTGRGAGGRGTASAVLRDLIDIKNNLVFR